MVELNADKITLLVSLNQFNHSYIVPTDNSLIDL